MGVDSDHAEDFATSLTKSLYGLEAAPTCGDQILYDEDTTASRELSFDLVTHTMILSHRTDVDEGKTKQVSHQCTLSNSPSSDSSNDVWGVELSTDSLRQLRLDQGTDVGV